ncbi:MAG: beta-ketoacyl-ACP synthase II [Holosporales bacterium]|jgi:3-oxoacyl-[acyl-carrier-protein] synthase II|nr:beta-ketoacyl-ACP synthase II [Holosporales bacterium]
MKRRVVITGIGGVTPLGANVDSFWKNLIAGKSGIGEVCGIDVSDMSSRIAAQLSDDFSPDPYLSHSEQRHLDRFVICAIVAAEEAVKDAGYTELSEIQKKRTAVIVGSGIGGINTFYDTSITLHNEGAKRVSPFFIPSLIINIASGHIAIRHNLKGPNYGIVSACATGNHSIGEAFRMIQYGTADFALAGGTESSICRIAIAGFAASRALSTKYNNNPELASQPWNKGRDGFVMGEGAGVLALEEYEIAKKRGAKIYGEIIGYGASCDAFHITAPLGDGVGAAQAMQAALDDARIECESVDYINAHGTSTVPGDIAEIIAIKKVFGNHIAKLGVSSTKSSIGHLLGAAGAIESIVCLLAMRDSIRPATLNLVDPDDVCEGVNLIPLTPQEGKIAISMNNSFGFGGTNASLIFKKI